MVETQMTKGEFLQIMKKSLALNPEFYIEGEKWHCIADLEGYLKPIWSNLDAFVKDENIDMESAPKVINLNNPKFLPGIIFKSVQGCTLQIESQADTWETWSDLAFSMYNLGLMQEAYLSFKFLNQSNPSNIPCQINIKYLEAGENTTAKINGLSTFFGKDKGLDIFLNKRIAELYFVSGNTAKTMEHVENVIKADAKDWGAKNNLAIACLASENVDGAYNLMADVIKDNDHDVLNFNWIILNFLKENKEVLSGLLSKLDSGCSKELQALSEYCKKNQK